VEVDRLFHLRILQGGEREAHGQEMMRIEAGINLLQTHEAIDHQASPDEQRQRQSKLRNDQEVAQTPAAGDFPTSTASAFERFTQIGIDVIEGRHEAE
jgi:hypothetical protein